MSYYSCAQIEEDPQIPEQANMSGRHKMDVSLCWVPDQKEVPFKDLLNKDFFLLGEIVYIKWDGEAVQYLTKKRTALEPNRLCKKVGSFKEEIVSP